jgi:hypothetical protein
MDSRNLSEEQLLKLLHRCTVSLSTTDADGQGTGFFVAPGLILTCAHVVDTAWSNHTPVTAYWNGQTYAAHIQQFLAETHPDLKFLYPDLALLKVDNYPDHPCVYLHREVHLGDKLYSYGYTDKYSTGDPSTFNSEGWTDERQLLLKLKEGQVRPGLSGAPILNRRTGGVCSVMKRSHGIDTDIGGRAIPTQEVFQKFPELEAQQKVFHKQDTRWYDCLTQQQRQILGLEDPSPALEIFCLYADIEEDKKLLAKLEAHLAVMRKQGLINTWHKGKLVEYGEDEMSQINEHLEKASIILLLVSSDFMNLHYLDSTEVEEAMERRKAGVRVIPVILRPSDWRDGPFGGLIPLPRDGEPISSRNRDRDEKLLEVTQGIRAVVKQLKKRV